jgi:hypothetical protein
MRVRRTAIIGAAIVAATLLSGCTAPAVAEPSPTQKATPSSTPTPEPAPILEVDPIDTVTTFVVRPEALELRDVTGALVLELDYLTDPAAAVATITAVLGSAPIDETHSGGSHFPPSTMHRWGAFELHERRYVDRWEFAAAEPRTLHQPEFSVIFTGPQTADVTLTTAQGVAAGTSWADLEANPGLQTNPSGCSGPYLDYITQDFVRSDGTVHEQRYGVDFAADPSSTVIAKIRAPLGIYDGCA